MLEQIKFNIAIYSPRWGHDDSYRFEINKHRMKIRNAGKEAICLWVEGHDPKWSGHDSLTGNPLQNILENDSIYPPSIFVSALTSAWEAWRMDDIDSDQLKSEISELCNWLNVVSTNRPKSEFWRMIF